MAVNWMTSNFKNTKHREKKRYNKMKQMFWKRNIIFCQIIVWLLKNFYVGWLEVVFGYFSFVGYEKKKYVYEDAIWELKRAINYMPWSINTFTHVYKQDTQKNTVYCVPQWNNTKFFSSYKKWVYYIQIFFGYKWSKIRAEPPHVEQTTTTKTHIPILIKTLRKMIEWIIFLFLKITIIQFRNSVWMFNKWLFSYKKL